MEVILAKTAGFCFGVERAVAIAYEEAEKKNFPLYTYGPLIHNEEVISDLEKRGVHVIENEEELREIHEGTVIIRTHGAVPRIYDIIRQNGLGLIDATCPFVKKIHRIVQKHSEEGYSIMIAGDERHPEVIGIMGWCVNNHIYVVKSKENLENFENKWGEKVCVVSQTTFNAKKFQELVAVCEENDYTDIVVNTICNATDERQKEAREIASQADAMVVIGGKNSSNTRKLYEICKDECDRTYFIQTLDDFAFNNPEEIHTIGITAGASTPKKIIEEVQNYVRNE